MTHEYFKERCKEITAELSKVDAWITEAVFLIINAKANGYVLSKQMLEEFEETDEETLRKRVEEFGEYGHEQFFKAYPTIEQKHKDVLQKNLGDSLDEKVEYMADTFRKIVRVGESYSYFKPKVGLNGETEEDIERNSRAHAKRCGLDESETAALYQFVSEVKKLFPEDKNDKQK